MGIKLKSAQCSVLGGFSDARLFAEGSAGGLYGHRSPWRREMGAYTQRLLLSDADLCQKIVIDNRACSVRFTAPCRSAQADLSCDSISVQGQSSGAVEEPTCASLFGTFCLQSRRTSYSKLCFQRTHTFLNDRLYGRNKCGESSSVRAGTAAPYVDHRRGPAGSSFYSPCWAAGGECPRGYAYLHIA